MNPSGLRAEVVERWGVKLSHDQAYVAKRKAMKLVQGAVMETMCLEEFSETKDSWKWFLDLLMHDLEGYSQRSYAFILDQQKGLVPVVQGISANVESILCVKHLYGNWKKKHPGLELKEVLWAAARETTVPSWERAILRMKAMKEDTWEDIIQLVIEKNKKQAQGWSPTWHGDDNLSIFGVTNGIETYCVDLKKEACSCRKCDLSGIPCCHVIACIWNIKKQLEDYVTACYRKSTFMDTYSNIVYSTNEPQLWLVDDLNIMAPPVMRRVMGRQKKQRNKMNDEPRNPHILPSRFLTVKCAKCGAMGHNKRSCKGKRAADRAIPKGGNKSKKTKKVKGGK
ncbi:uncharacterized protein LOC127129931 [Lathyrus oleraceus]|uniref:uncharacterized protein LOC127129931 n=1 Tax=Pisum sativum TaxID=3888 RepID=UPI0021D0A536|nr:uncharacterized protein LOC127129931 [Pisum sativum]